MNPHSTTDADDEQQTGSHATVAGHDVIRPDTAGGVNIDAAARRDAQRGNPASDVINRQPNVTYHVAPRALDDEEEPSGAGVLVTFLRLSKAESWTNASLRGTSRELNTSRDVVVEALVSPLARHTTLPDAASFDPENDQHAERVTVRASRVLPQERLRTESIDPDEVETHDLVPGNAAWFRLNS